MNSKKDTTSSPDLLAFLLGGGEMGNRIQMFDWENTPLGPISGWSPSLRIMLRIMLANHFPHILFWGPRYTQFYNDSCIPVLGIKHPDKALGRPASECWVEIWQIIGPLIERAFHGDLVTWDDSICLEINRCGIIEECHFTFDFSSVPDENAPGGIGGVLVMIHDITSIVMNGRRMLVLRNLEAQSAEAQTVEKACTMVLQTLANHSKDIPFALIYLIDSNRKQAYLEGSFGVAIGGSASPPVIPLEGDDANYSIWPLWQVMRSKSVQVLSNLPDNLRAQVSPGFWTGRPHSAAIFPLLSNKTNYMAGFLVAGLSVCLQFDEPYKDFLKLVSSQIATAIVNGREYEEKKERAKALTRIERAETVQGNELLPVQFRSQETEKYPCIYVADNNEDMRQYLALILTKRYNVKVFPDGLAALEAVRKHHPDLILSDVMMPLLDGFGLVRKIRADASLNMIPIILLSARAGEDSHAEDLEQGADDYLFKPFSTHELLARVAVHLEMARLRKEASEQIRQSEERFRIAVKNSNCVLSQFDRNLRYTWIYNPRPDLDVSLLVGKRSNEPEDIKRTQKMVTLMRQVVENGRGVREEISLNHSNGVHTYDTLIEPLCDDTGAVIGGTISGLDITEHKRAEDALKKVNEILEERIKERTLELETAYGSLKESEERLADAQKIAHVGSWERDLATDKLYWSDEVYRIYGLDPQEFDINFGEFLKRIHPEDIEKLNYSIKEALNGRLYGIEYRIILPDGEERVISGHGRAIFDENNAPIRLRGVVQDITERKRSEETLAKIEKMRIKEIHHRIKNNLQVISSLLDLQAEKIGDESIRQAFSESQNRVLSMSLIHEELYKANEADTLDFSAYLEKLAENLFKTYGLNSKNIRLSMDLEENAFIDMDTAVPLGIIVNELISNSLKHAFTEKKEGEIRIQLYRYEEMNNKTQESIFSLTISDNGKGIPEDMELENVESLGLQLISILVAQLDGDLKLKRGNGTEFTINFTIREKTNCASMPTKMQLVDNQ